MMRHSRHALSTLTLLLGVTACAAQEAAPGTIAFTNVNVVPMDSERVVRVSSRRWAPLTR